MTLNPLEQVNYVTIASLLAIFWVTYFVLRRILFTPVIQNIERRAGKIEAAKAKQGELTAIISQAEREAEFVVAEAREAAENLAEDAKLEAAKIREERIAAANAQAEAILAKGREEISVLKDAERSRLKEELVACAEMTIAKLVGKVEKKTVLFIVNKVLASRRMGV